MRPVYDRTGGVDGRVSIEVEPQFAHDTGQDRGEARALAAAVDRPNAYVKIPATVEGLPAIAQCLAEGISVNVTLIFSLDRYRGVMQSFLTGLEQARDAGRDLSSIRSVASFFVSRVDSEVDKRLDAMSNDEAGPPCAARRASRTPGSPSRPTRRCSRPHVGRCWPPTGPIRSGRCGPPPA